MYKEDFALIVLPEPFHVFKSLNMTYSSGCESVVYSSGVAWWLCGWRLTCDSHRWVLTWTLLFRRHLAGDIQHRAKCFQVTKVCKLVTFCFTDVEITKGNQGCMWWSFHE